MFLGCKGISKRGKVNFHKKSECYPDQQPSIYKHVVRMCKSCKNLDLPLKPYVYLLLGKSSAQNYYLADLSKMAHGLMY